MKYILLLLFGFAINMGIAQSDLERAAKLKAEAKTEYDNGNYKSALSKINSAIAIIKDRDMAIPGDMTKLRNDINAKIRSQEKAAELKEQKREYDNYLQRARNSISNQNYSDARSYLNQALDAYPSGSEAKRLLNELDDIKNRNEASSLVSDADRALNNGDKRKALRLYEQARRLNPDGVSSYKIRELENDIKNYDRLTQEAENAYFDRDYQKAIDLLGEAKRYMSLEKEDVELRDRCNYKKHLERGDYYMQEKSYGSAENEYQTAKMYASSSSTSEINRKIKNARYQKYLAQASNDYDNGRIEDANNAINRAEQEQSLDSEGRELKRKILIKLEDILWAKRDYKEYLRVYPNGRYVAEAKQALYNYNFASGERARKSHNYYEALQAYNRAKEYAAYGNSSEVNNKIQQTYRWRNAGGDPELDFNFDLPLGFAATSLITRDYYSFTYLLDGEMGEYPIGDNGTGYTKHSKYSIFAPISLGVDLKAPIKIPSVPPLRVYAGLSFTSYSVFNLDQIQAVQDYEIYNEGGEYEPTGETVVDRDTNYMGLYMNGTKFTQFSGKVGVTFLDFVTLYVPFQKVALNVQPGLPCLECAEDEIQVGQFGVGLGLKLDYTIDFFTVSAFWENWNKNFNKNLTNNVMFDGSTAGLGTFSPNAFSRNLGVQMAFAVSDAFSLGIRYENPVVRGEFRGLNFGNKEVHNFSQHLLRARLTYNLPL